jgi:REP element-mobilizing transposase RayT
LPWALRLMMNSSTTSWITCDGRPRSRPCALGEVLQFCNYPPKVRLPCRGGLWTPSYFAGSVGGAPLSVLKQYIEQWKGAAISSR